MKRNFARWWIALAILVLPVRGAGTVEFSGYFRTGESYRFVLTDPADATSSGWLELGREFHGCRLVSFDAKAERLTIQQGAETLQLPLKLAVTKDAPAGESSRPAGVVTESGVYSDGERQAGSVGSDNHGNPVHWFHNGRFSGSKTGIVIAPGKMFGFFADLSGLPASASIELEYLFATPPMRLPDGRVISSSFFTSSVATKENGTLPRQGISYSFDHDYELVPGKYRMELRYRSKLLAAEEFDLQLPVSGKPLSAAETKTEAIPPPPPPTVRIPPR